jgi:hypothetical protein
MKALNPKTVAELASGNPDKFANNASKAIIGTMQLGLANYLRNSEYRGEKWYEVKVGDKTYDTRAYAPMISPYMLISESISHPENLKAADWAGAVIGLNRIAGSGLVLTDIIRSKDVESISKTIGKVAGEYLGSFSVPFRTFQDIYSAAVPDKNAIRDTRERPLLGPIMRNIPGLSETLPEMVSPLKSERVRTEHPLLRQLTGLSVKTKTLMEKEVDRLGIETSTYYPKTGIPEADRELSKYMGPAIEQIAPKLLTQSRYGALDDNMKEMVLDQIFKEAKEMARKRLMKDNPTLGKRVKFEKINPHIKELMKFKGIQVPR